MNQEMLCDKIDSSMIPKSSIAEALGITRQAFYKKLNGKREFKNSEIKTLAMILHLTSKERDDIFFADYVDE